MDMVNIKNLTRTFVDDAGPFNVLNSIDLSIKKGELVSFIGTSGAGKTTLLQIIGGLDKPTSGTIEIDGIDLSKIRPKEMATFRAKQIGFVFQFHHLLPDFTALENVIIPGMIVGGKKQDILKRGNELLDIVGLADRKTHFPSELSGGERQRVALARALFNKPALLLADEPTGNLDTGNSLQLLEMIRTANRELGQTFLIATHDQRLSEGMDRTIYIEDGKIKG